MLKIVEVETRYGDSSQTQTTVWLCEELADIITHPRDPLDKLENLKIIAETGKTQVKKLFISSKLRSLLEESIQYIPLKK